MMLSEARIIQRPELQASGKRRSCWLVFFDGKEVKMLKWLAAIVLLVILSGCTMINGAGKDLQLWTEPYVQQSQAR
jgi:predicted small secreted protein